MHLLLHIGPHKTGSSSIQRALEIGRDTLARNGVLYPAAEQFPAWSLAALYATGEQRAHPMLRQKLPTDAAVEAWSRKNWQELERQVTESDADLCILSSEHFASQRDAGPMLAHLGRLFSGITVLAYAREPAALYLSALQQRIQGGQCLRDLSTPRGYRYTLRRQLETYIDGVGRENVILRHFRRDNLEEGDVVADFLARLSRFGKKISIPGHSVNESLPGAAIAWLLMVNETWDRSALTDMRKKVITRLKRSPAVAQLPGLRFDERLSEQFIQARAREDVDWLNRTFLTGQVPLAIGDGDAGDLPDESALREIMRDWITGYLTPEAIAVIAEVVVGTQKQPRRKAGNG